MPEKVEQVGAKRHKIDDAMLDKPLSNLNAPKWDVKQKTIINNWIYGVGRINNHNDAVKIHVLKLAATARKKIFYKICPKRNLTLRRKKREKKRGVHLSLLLS